MTPLNIFEQYLTLAKNTEVTLQSFNKHIALFGVKQNKTELTYLHRHIRFFYTKLIRLLCNDQLWHTSVENSTRLIFSCNESSGISIQPELDFLINNRPAIIDLLECITNTAIFEIELKCLHSSYLKLVSSYSRLRDKTLSTFNEDRRHFVPADFTQYAFAS